MYKITCFVPISPEDLETALRGMHFKCVKGSFEWSIDGTTVFKIEPFKNQPRLSQKAYRVYFNCDIAGAAYLFDTSLGYLGASITAVEYTLTDSNYKTLDWISRLNKQPKIKREGPGIFVKEGIGAIVVNDSVVFQLRSRKNKNLILFDCIKKIEDFLQDVKPEESFDLFSCLEVI